MNMAHRQFSLDEGLESVGFGRFQWMLLVLSGIGFCATTVELILVSLIKGLLMEQWPKVGNEKFALLTSVTFAGEIIGGFFWAAVSDRLGRRKTFAGTALVAAVSGMLGSVAPCFYTFTITRFFLGAAMGGCLSIDIIYFLEFVPTVSRGFRTTFIIFMGICAFFYTALVGWLTLPNWRVFVFCCGAPYGLLFVGRMFWRWESPRFLLTRGRTSEAKRVLHDMARHNGTFLPDGDLAPLEATKDSAQGVSSLLTARVLAPLGTVCALFFFQTFAYYGLVLWMPDYIKLRGIKNLDPVTTFLFIGLSELPGLTLTTLLVERVGRRVMLLINFCGSAVACALLVTVDSRTGFLLVSSMVYFFIVGSWAMIYIATPEMFPTSCRATAFSVAGAFGKLGGMTSPHIFAYLWDSKASETTIVGTVSGSFLLAALIAGVFMMETGGRQLSDR